MSLSNAIRNCSRFISDHRLIIYIFGWLISVGASSVEPADPTVARTGDEPVNPLSVTGAFKFEHVSLVIYSIACIGEGKTEIKSEGLEKKAPIRDERV